MGCVCVGCRLYLGVNIWRVFGVSNQSCVIVLKEFFSVWCSRVWSCSRICGKGLFVVQAWVRMRFSRDVACFSSRLFRSSRIGLRCLHSRCRCSRLPFSQSRSGWSSCSWSWHRGQARYLSWYVFLSFWSIAFVLSSVKKVSPSLQEPSMFLNCLSL